MVSERIKFIIENSGLSLFKFSARTKVAKSTLVHYRDGASSPPLDFLEAVCTEFGVNPEWLLLGKGDPYGKPEQGGGAIATSASPCEVSYIDQAVQLVNEAIAETGAKVSDRQKEALIEIVREEIRKEAKDKAVGVLKVLTGGK